MSGRFISLLSIGLAAAGSTWAAWTCEGRSPAPQQKIQPSAAVSTVRPDLSKLSLQHRQIYLSAQRGADWLVRANRPDGRFVHGYVPALRMVMEGHDFLHQAGAAFALARSARYFKDEKAAAIATQAVLTLLLETTQDPKEPAVRYTSLPGALLNRVSASAMIVLAIHELPAPGKDLLDQADQLCEYIRRQQRPDGSFKLLEQDDAKEDEPLIVHYPGPALYALAQSAKHRPAAWKGDAVRKACAFYHSKWRQQRTLAMTYWHTAAYVEALSKAPDKLLADCVFEMNDWLTTLQHARKDPRRPLWFGGFKRAQSAPLSEPPSITTASAAASLCEACRIARQTTDLSRLNRYRQAADQAMSFLTTLQYTEANTQHFAEWYRPVLVGAFHASHQEGDIRLDYTNHAVSAMVQYLQHAAE